MKTKFLALFILLFSITVFSQNGFKALLQKHPLHTKKQCRKAETTVLKLANYLISNPLHQDDIKRMNAAKYIQRWAVQTPDYYFEIPQEIIAIAKNNKKLKAVHKALLVKYVLTHSNTDTKSIKVRKKVLRSFLEYIEKPRNNVKITKQIKKYIHYKNKRELNILIK